VTRLFEYSPLCGAAPFLLFLTGTVSMAKFYLPCECGESVVIEPRQAGQTASCECGASLAIPKFRDISKLKPVEETQQQAARWSPLQGAMFAGGIVIFILAASAAGYFFWEASRYNPTRPTLSELADLRPDDEQIATASPTDLRRMWEFVERDGLDRPGRPVWARHRDAMRIHRVSGSVAAAFAVAGAGMIVASLFLRL